MAVSLFISINSIAKDDKKFTDDCDWLSPFILEWNLYKKLFDGLDNKRCLEVGSFEGRSTIYFVENYCNGKNSYVDAVDTWLGSRDIKKDYSLTSYDRFINNLGPYIKTHRVNIHQGQSSDVLMKLLSEVKEGKREKYDFIYIDASHDAKDVFMDIALSWVLLKKDGLMFFDDYELGEHVFMDQPWFTPRPAIDGFLNSYFTMYKILDKNYQLRIQKIVD